jgi:hypothetical protein
MYVDCGTRLNMVICNDSCKFISRLVDIELHEAQQLTTFNLLKEVKGN